MSDAKSGGQIWTAVAARTKFSEVMLQAKSAAQTITFNGRPRVVVVSVDEWARKSNRQGSLASFLMNSPLRGSLIDTERQHD